MKNTSVVIFSDEGTTYLVCRQSAITFREFFTKSASTSSQTGMADHDGLDEQRERCETLRDSNAAFLGYLSDISNDDSIEESGESENEDPPAKRTWTESTHGIRVQARAARRKELVLALNDIETTISSKRTVLDYSHTMHTPSKATFAWLLTTTKLIHKLWR